MKEKVPKYELVIQHIVSIVIKFINKYDFERSVWKKKEVFILIGSIEQRLEQKVVFSYLPLIVS